MSPLQAELATNRRQSLIAALDAEFCAQHGPEATWPPAIAAEYDDLMDGLFRAACPITEVA